MHEGGVVVVVGGDDRSASSGGGSDDGDDEESAESSASIAPMTTYRPNQAFHSSPRSTPLLVRRVDALEPDYPRRSSPSTPVSAPTTSHAGSLLLLQQPQQAQQARQPPKRYECAHCLKRFRTKYALRTHERAHTGEKPYACSTCNACFSQLSTLRQHERIHTGESPYKCKYCPKAFKKAGHCKRHELLHTGEKPHKCPLCNARFADRSNMKRHEAKHALATAYSCLECGKRFTQQARLDEHMKFHSLQRPHQCGTCLLRFEKKSNLARHVQSHASSDISSFSCRFCPAQFKSRAYRTRHEKAAHTAPNSREVCCPVCNVVFESYRRFTAHASLAHPDQAGPGSRTPTTPRELPVEMPKPTTRRFLANHTLAHESAPKYPRTATASSAVVSEGEDASALGTQPSPSQTGNGHKEKRAQAPFATNAKHAQQHHQGWRFPPPFSRPVGSPQPRDLCNANAQSSGDTRCGGRSTFDGVVPSSLPVPVPVPGNLTHPLQSVAPLHLAQPRGVDAPQNTVSDPTSKTLPSAKRTTLAAVSHLYYHGFSSADAAKAPPQPMSLHLRPSFSSHSPQVPQIHQHQQEQHEHQYQVSAQRASNPEVHRGQQHGSVEQEESCSDRRVVSAWYGLPHQSESQSQQKIPTSTQCTHHQQQPHAVTSGHAARLHGYATDQFLWEGSYRSSSSAMMNVASSRVQHQHHVLRTHNAFPGQPSFSQGSSDPRVHVGAGLHPPGVEAHAEDLRDPLHTAQAHCYPDVTTASGGFVSLPLSLPPPPRPPPPSYLPAALPSSSQFPQAHTQQHRHSVHASKYVNYGSIPNGVLTPPVAAQDLQHLHNRDAAARDDDIDDISESQQDAGLDDGIGCRLDSRYGEEDAFVSVSGPVALSHPMMHMPMPAPLPMPTQLSPQEESA